MKTKRLKKNHSLFVILSLFFSFMITISYPVYAYFKEAIQEKVKPTLDIRILFGTLDDSLASGEWGTDGNPYLIMNNEHLSNLYVLQNSPDSYLIDEDSVFQVSNEWGEPNYVGSLDKTKLFKMNSIGTEEYPFVSKIRGVTTTDPNKYIQLPSGEYTDTSVIGNIQIEPVPNQVDIGLFGNVGPNRPEDIPTDPSQYIGAISTLLLYNVQIKSTSVGNPLAGHNYTVTTPTTESNHLGILVGHAQYVNLDKISVYYSRTNNVSDVSAFDIKAGDKAKYTTSGGIVGYYKRVVIDGETTYPVSSDGSSIGVGNSASGLGQGIVYSTDIWTYMEENTSVGSPAPDYSYDLQNTFGDELYKDDDNSYFHVGVFTFAHSRQARGRDRLAKLWTSDDSQEWTIATNGTTGYTQTTKNMGPATKYYAKKITRANHAWSSSAGNLSAPYNDQNYFRYMITYESGGKVYALVRYGSQAIGVEVNPNDLVIPDGEIQNYTFENLSARVADSNYPPKTEGFAYRYQTPVTMEFRADTNTSSSARLQYAVYGNLITEEGNSSNILEAPRPLRIYTASGVQPTTSFMATASAAAFPYVEGYRISPVATTTSNELYKLQRTGVSSTGERPSTGVYATFNPTTGFSATNTSSSATQFKLYAVRIKADTAYPSENPVATTYNMQDYQPVSNAPQKTYNMNENVLYYTGNPNDSNASNRYKYTMRSVESLGWYDNDDNIIKKADTALIMSDPTSYYYIRNAQDMDIYFGVKTDIPSPIGSGTIKVPEGSIGFTVNGSQTTGTTAEVRVIVATDPRQGVEQHITISRFGSGTNLVGDRNIQESFILPPAPMASVSGLTTQPIYLTDGGSTYTVYPSFNTVLVAYTFHVPVEKVAVTYFLEASRGTAQFVYLAGERLAANDYNPFHENDVKIPSLIGLDYVFTVKKNINSIQRDFVATVGNDGYVASLTVPYFGITNNPAYDEKTNPNVDHYLITAVTGFNFTYNISRVYDPNSEQKNQMYITILADVNGSGYAPVVTVAQLKEIQKNMNFNFSENSFLDTTIYEYIYSDQVTLYINGYLLYDWSVLG